MNDLVLVQGMRDTKLTLKRWNEQPARVLKPWVIVSFAVSVGLLTAIWVVATLTPTDVSDELGALGVYRSPDLDDYLFVLARNSLVLALHGMACVAGFMAGSAIPLSAANRNGFDRWIHEKAGRFAIGFVVCATTFSLGTQAYIIGGDAAIISKQLGLSPGVLVLGLLPHALPELVALFLPLAAWLIASRRGRWEELLAATFVTVGCAVPVLLLTGVIELWLSPELIRVLAGR